MLFTTFFQQLTGNKYHVTCAASAEEPALKFGQDKINNVLEMTGVHGFSQHVASHREKGDVTTVATYCSVTILLVYMNNVGIFQLLLVKLFDQQSRIKSCSLLLREHPPCLITSAELLSGPAVLLSLRQRMASTSTSKMVGHQVLG